MNGGPQKAVQKCMPWVDKMDDGSKQPAEVVEEMGESVTSGVHTSEKKWCQDRQSDEPVRTVPRKPSTSRRVLGELQKIIWTRSGSTWTCSKEGVGAVGTRQVLQHHLRAVDLVAQAVHSRVWGNTGRRRRPHVIIETSGHHANSNLRRERERSEGSSWRTKLVTGVVGEEIQEIVARFETSTTSGEDVHLAFDCDATREKQWRLESKMRINLWLKNEAPIFGEDKEAERHWEDAGAREILGEGKGRPDRCRNQPANEVDSGLLVWKRRERRGSMDALIFGGSRRGCKCSSQQESWWKGEGPPWWQSV